jgi:ribosome maturation factor RimP
MAFGASDWRFALATTDSIDYPNPIPTLSMQSLVLAPLRGRRQTAFAGTAGEYGVCMADIARITSVVEPEVKALGFELVRVMLIGKSEAGDDEPALQIMAEDPATGQLVIDQCAELSRRISDRIDALEEAGEVLIEGAWRLEVSSPGIDRPLTRFRDFAQWEGHEAKVELSELLDGRKRFRGNLAGVQEKDEVVGIASDEEIHHIPFDLIANAKLVLTDRLIAATRPLDFSGADEILEQDLEEEEG